MNDINLAFSAVSDPEIKGLPKTINGVAYTGALIKNHGALGNVVVDLDSIKIPEKLLLLSDHDRTIRLGLGRVRKNNGLLLLTASILDDESTLTLRRQLAAGLPLGLSIGVTGIMERPTQPVMVNGTMRTADTVIRNARLNEVSIVSFGADSDALITAAFKQVSQERELSRQLFNQVAGYD